jgi:HD-GYP domain-containing protein (c-di-GMP phosphodiesterase class II)
MVARFVIAGSAGTPKRVGKDPTAVRDSHFNWGLIIQGKLPKQAASQGDTMSDQATAAGTSDGTDFVAATVEALARALELHDYRRGRFGETAAHTARVTQLALLLTEHVAPELLLDPQLAHGYRLHDIGMIGVSNSTLLKPGTLTSAELDEVREHPWLGERIVAPVPALGGLARQVIACHHERWNGSGYPRGLRGVEIPVAARIFAVVDSFDAMVSEQPYRDALPVDAARDELMVNAGLEFDPDVVEAFLLVDLPPVGSV